jgi:cytosine/adenosine deaminase-related metal-dependent hydrolase
MIYALQASYVFPVDSPPIKCGVVTIEGERIAAVGVIAEASNLIDLGAVALLPGFVNCHTHLEFSYLRQPLGVSGMPLFDWVRLVIAERGRRDYAPAASIAKGLCECISYGVTSLGDISTIEPAAYESAKSQLNAYSEVIGFSLARAESAMSVLAGRLALYDAMPRSGEEPFDDIKLGISPHAPYTVSPRLLERLIAVAQQRDMPVAMHLAESAEELQFLRSGTGPFQELLDERSMWDPAAVPHGSSPMDYLRMLAQAPRTLVIHGNYLVEQEWTYLGARADRMSIVYCPRTHAYFGHAPYALRELLAAGVHVALGTDSRASNPDLSLLAEMRHIAKTFPEIDPQTLLRMGTLAGARALGREANVGTIAPGKLANLVAVPLNGDPTNAVDALSSLFEGEAGPSNVWCRGVAYSA